MRVSAKWYADLLATYPGEWVAIGDDGEVAGHSHSLGELHSHGVGLREHELLMRIPLVQRTVVEDMDEYKARQIHPPEPPPEPVVIEQPLNTQVEDGIPVPPLTPADVALIAGSEPK